MDHISSKSNDKDFWLEYAVRNNIILIYLLVFCRYVPKPSALIAIIKMYDMKYVIYSRQRNIHLNIFTSLSLENVQSQPPTSHSDPGLTPSNSAINSKSLFIRLLSIA